MAFFEVEGTTLVGWTAHVDAQDEPAAVDEVQRRAGEAVSAACSADVSSRHHQITRCQPSFRIEGTTLVTWTARVIAENEPEARASAPHGAFRLGGLAPDLPVNDVRHRVSRSRRVEAATAESAVQPLGGR